MQSLMSVCFHSIFWWTDSPLTLTMSQGHSSPGTESQGHRSRSMQKCACYTSIYCGVLWVLIDGRNSRFNLLSRHQLRASAARRAAQPSSATTAESARVGMVTWSVWPRSSIKDSFYSWFSFLSKISRGFPTANCDAMLLQLWCHW